MKVLLVDDWPYILRSVQRVLRLHIPDDVEFLTLSEPMKVLESEFTDLDLVISDYHMPGMNGLELISHLRKTNPRMITVLFSSAPPRSAGEEVDYVVSKASIERLCEIVREVRAQHG
jgi:response regulator RpfG family c-di-GMP phosphodiesterase